MPAPVIRFVITEDKTGLHPFRLLSILSLAWLTVRLVPLDAAWLRSRLAAPLVLIGQNSLPVFCSGIFFGFLARLGLEADEGAAMQIAVNLLGALAMVAVGGLAAWYRSKGRVPAARGSRSPCRQSRGLIPDRLECAVWSPQSPALRHPRAAGTIACRQRHRTTPAARPTNSSPPRAHSGNSPRRSPRAVQSISWRRFGDHRRFGDRAGRNTSAAQGASFPWHMVRALHAALPGGAVPRRRCVAVAA